MSSSSLTRIRVKSASAPQGRWMLVPSSAAVVRDVLHTVLANLGLSREQIQTTDLLLHGTPLLLDEGVAVIRDGDILELKARATGMTDADNAKSKPFPKFSTPRNPPTKRSGVKRPSTGLLFKFSPKPRPPGIAQTSQSVQKTSKPVSLSSTAKTPRADLPCANDIPAPASHLTPARKVPAVEKRLKFTTPSDKATNADPPKDSVSQPQDPVHTSQPPPTSSLQLKPLRAAGPMLKPVPTVDSVVDSVPSDKQCRGDAVHVKPPQDVVAKKHPPLSPPKGPPSQVMRKPRQAHLPTDEAPVCETAITESGQTPRDSHQCDAFSTADGTVDTGMVSQGATRGCATVPSRVSGMKGEYCRESAPSSKAEVINRKKKEKPSQMKTQRKSGVKPGIGPVRGRLRGPQIDKQAPAKDAVATEKRPRSASAADAPVTEPSIGGERSVGVLPVRNGSMLELTIEERQGVPQSKGSVLPHKQGMTLKPVSDAALTVEKSENVVKALPKQSSRFGTAFDGPFRQKVPRTAAKPSVNAEQASEPGTKPTLTQTYQCPEYAPSSDSPIVAGEPLSTATGTPHAAHAKRISSVGYPSADDESMQFVNADDKPNAIVANPKRSKSLQNSTPMDVRPVQEVQSLSDKRVRFDPPRDQIFVCEGTVFPADPVPCSPPMGQSSSESIADFANPFMYDPDPDKPSNSKTSAAAKRQPDDQLQFDEFSSQEATGFGKVPPQFVPASSEPEMFDASQPENTVSHIASRATISVTRESTFQACKRTDFVQTTNENRNSPNGGEERKMIGVQLDAERDDAATDDVAKLQTTPAKKGLSVAEEMLITETPEKVVRHVEEKPLRKNVKSTLDSEKPASPKLRFSATEETRATEALGRVAISAKQKKIRTNAESTLDSGRTITSPLLEVSAVRETQLTETPGSVAVHVGEKIRKFAALASDSGKTTTSPKQEFSAMEEARITKTPGSSVVQVGGKEVREKSESTMGAESVSTPRERNDKLIVHQSTTSNPPPGVAAGPLKARNKRKRCLSAEGKRKRNARNRRREQRKRRQARERRAEHSVAEEGSISQSLSRNAVRIREGRTSPVGLASMPQDEIRDDNDDSALIQSEELNDVGKEFTELPGPSGPDIAFVDLVTVGDTDEDPAVTKLKCVATLDGLEQRTKQEQRLQCHEKEQATPVSQVQTKTTGFHVRSNADKLTKKPSRLMQSSVAAALRMARSHGVLERHKKEQQSAVEEKISIDSNAGSSTSGQEILTGTAEGVSTDAVYVSAVPGQPPSKKRKLSKRARMYIDEEQYNESVFVGFESSGGIPLPSPDLLSLLDCPLDTIREEELSPSKETMHKQDVVQNIEGRFNKPEVARNASLQFEDEHRETNIQGRIQEVAGHYGNHNSNESASMHTGLSTRVSSKQAQIPEAKDLKQHPMVASKSATPCKREFGNTRVLNRIRKERKEDPSDLKKHSPSLTKETPERVASASTALHSMNAKDNLGSSMNAKELKRMHPRQDEDPRVIVNEQHISAGPGCRPTAERRNKSQTTFHESRQMRLSGASRLIQKPAPASVNLKGREWKSEYLTTPSGKILNTSPFSDRNDPGQSSAKEDPIFSKGSDFKRAPSSSPMGMKEKTQSLPDKERASSDVARNVKGVAAQMRIPRKPVPDTTGSVTMRIPRKPVPGTTGNVTMRIPRKPVPGTSGTLSEICVEQNIEDLTGEVAGSGSALSVMQGHSKTASHTNANYQSRTEIRVSSMQYSAGRELSPSCGEVPLPNLSEHDANEGQVESFPAPSHRVSSETSYRTNLMRTLTETTNEVGQFCKHRYSN